MLLGASNVALGFRAAVRAARERLSAPLEVFAAIGHGRSFGNESSVFGRSLPGITGCGLWPRIQQCEPISTYAIVTDIGNDLAYGYEPWQLQVWLEESLAQLAAINAHVVITALPLETLRKLPEWEFVFFSRLFFPHRRIERARMLAYAEEMDARVERIARERKLTRCVPRHEWYGHDPIHIARGARREAWRTFCAAWRLDGELFPVPARVRKPPATPFDAPWRQRGRLVPEQRKFFGVHAGREQSCAQLDDGTRFFLY